MNVARLMTGMIRKTMFWFTTLLLVCSFSTVHAETPAKADTNPAVRKVEDRKPAVRKVEDRKAPAKQAAKKGLVVPAPIPTKAGNTVDSYHGVKVADPYRWLENGKSKEVKAWGNKNQKRTRAVLDQIPARLNIIKELKKLYNNKSSTSPRKYGHYYFFYRREGLKNQPILYVREGKYNAAKRVLLDPNTLSKDGTVAIQQISPSPSGRFLAYALAAKGSDWSSVRVLNVATGQHLTDTIPQTRWPSMVWDQHGTGFFYTKYPPVGTVPKADKNYYRRVFYHLLGTLASQDRLIFGEGRRKETWLSPDSSSDKSIIFISASVDWSRNDLYYRKAGSGGPFLPLAVGLKGQFSADVIGNNLVVSTTYKAPKGRLVTIPIGNTAQKNWKVLIPEAKGVVLGFNLVKEGLLVHYLEDVTSRVALFTQKGKFVRNIPLPAKGTVSDLRANYNSSEIFFRFTSWIYPSVGYRYDIKTQKLIQLEKIQIPVDLTKYETKQVFYRSKDGTRVSMFLVYKKGIVLNGNNPTELYGYGGFEISLRPRFFPSLIPWLDRGGVFALANLRGGGEYGSAWHKAGRRAKKQNVYDDFIAAAEWLIKKKYTQSKRLGIRGGSNGGLLVAAVMTQRPDLFGAVICQVPLTDMIRFPISTVARLWIPEYGDPKKADEFKWLWAYSPYHRLQKDVLYPQTMVMTADHDDRVDPFHARKFAARLQANAKAGSHILLRIESKAGHGAGTPLTKRLAGVADRFAFLMWSFGMDLTK